MRFGELSILRIPSSELPINDRNNLAVARDEMAWTEVSVGELGPMLTRITQRGRFAVDLCKTL